MYTAKTGPEEISHQLFFSLTVFFLNKQIFAVGVRIMALPRILIQISSH